MQKHVIREIENKLWVPVPTSFILYLKYKLLCSTSGDRYAVGTVRYIRVADPNPDPVGSGPFW